MNGNLKREFEKRAPWVTKFIINGEEYGGKFDAMHDGRLSQFFKYFPKSERILELGSLEGGHTFGLASHPSVERVVGIEGRQINLDRAKFVQQLYEITNIEFVHANLEKINLTRFGKFNAIFCVGLLYHLQKPWELIEQLSRLSKNLFLWTHYANVNKANESVHGYKGMRYQEHGLADPLSGMSPSSFWPTFDALNEILNQYGFKSIHVIEDNPKHPHGPCVTLAATAESR